MEFIFMGIFALAIVAADQITKLLVINGIPLKTSVDAIPGLFHLTYVQNTGAAFSSLQGMRWLFLLVFILLVMLLLMYSKRVKILLLTKVKQFKFNF